MKKGTQGRSPDSLERFPKSSDSISSLTIRKPSLPIYFFQQVSTSPGIGVNRLNFKFANGPGHGES